MSSRSWPLPAGTEDIATHTDKGPHINLFTPKSGKAYVEVISFNWLVFSATQLNHAAVVASKQSASAKRARGPRILATLKGASATSTRHSRSAAMVRLCGLFAKLWPQLGTHHRTHEESSCVVRSGASWRQREARRRNRVRALP